MGGGMKGHMMRISFIFIIEFGAGAVADLAAGCRKQQRV